MARIRSIKPDFWTDEKIVELDMAARLLFIGSWNFADDNGNLPRSPKKLKMQVFPADSLDVEPLIQSLITHGMLIEYEVNGEFFLHIKGFRKHQVINRPSKSAIPTIQEADSAGVLTEPSLTEGKGKDKEKDKTPLTPLAGGNPASEPSRKAKARSERTTLQTFLDRCRESGESAISGYEPLLRYIREAGLPAEFVNLCWAEFKREFGPGGRNERKLQTLWRRHFQNYVEKNYFRLWYAKPEGDGVSYELTTVGLQAQAAGQRREAA